MSSSGSDSDDPDFEHNDDSSDDYSSSSDDASAYDSDDLLRADPGNANAAYFSCGQVNPNKVGRAMAGKRKRRASDNVVQPEPVETRPRHAHDQSKSCQNQDPEQNASDSEDDDASDSDASDDASHPMGRDSEDGASDSEDNASDSEDNASDSEDNASDSHPSGGPPELPTPAPPPAKKNKVNQHLKPLHPDDGGDSGSHARAHNGKVCEKCWLCTFCLHPKARQITTFITNNIAHLDILHMSAQIKDEVLRSFPRAKGIRKRDILRHIQEHMLHPNVKVASILRSLVTLAETLRGTIHQVDSESGTVMIDLKSTDMYLKTIASIKAVYALDSNKLLYNIAPPTSTQSSQIRD